MSIDTEDGTTEKAQRKVLMAGSAIALPVTLGLWLALYFGLPMVAGVETQFDRFMFALKCCCVGVLLCFFSGIEAVSHERLFSKAINPLLDVESVRLKVNLRYLQHTLEQLALFVPGLLALSQYGPSATSVRAVAATTIVWMISRAVFWIGYHKGQQYRAPGLMGMMQSVVVLLYVCWHFGYEVGGLGGALVVPAILVGTEVFLVRATRRPPS